MTSRSNNDVCYARGMNNDQIIYVRDELARGISPEDIRQSLKQDGYTTELINQLFSAVQESLTSTPLQAVPGVLTTPMLPEEKNSKFPVWVVVLLVVFGAVIITAFLLAKTTINQLNTARDQGYVMSDKTTLNNIRNMAEVYYETNEHSYLGLCNSSEMNRVSGQVNNLSCEDSSDAYRAYILSLDETTYCVDYSGFYGNIEKIPENVSCESQAERDLKTVSDFKDINRLESMRIKIELYYNDNNFSYSGFCNSTEGVSLLTVIERSECSDDDQTYRVSVDLFSGGYYCIDGSGTAGKFTTTPKGLSCQINADIPVATQKDKVDTVSETSDKNNTVNYVEDTNVIADEGHDVEISNQYILQEERLIFTEGIKLARQYYNENEQSYGGFCDYLLLTMSNSGLDFGCMSDDVTYRISSPFSDGTYQCTSDILNIAEENTSLTHQPDGLYCK